MPNFREENYRSTGNLSVNKYWTPTLSLAQTKLLEVRNVLELLNDTNVPAVMKLQASEVWSAVQKYPQNAPNPEKIHCMLAIIYNQFSKTA